jgi:hypothetical protein
VTVPPVFEGDIAVFYTSERTSLDGNLHFYYYNWHLEQLELIDSSLVIDGKETGISYAKYSLVKLGTANLNQGILFNAYIDSDDSIVTKRYDISGFTENTVIGDFESDITELLDNADWSTYTSDISQARKDFIFKQIAEDPFHYAIS